MKRVRNFYVILRLNLNTNVRQFKHFNDDECIVFQCFSQFGKLFCHLFEFQSAQNCSEFSLGQWSMGFCNTSWNFSIKNHRKTIFCSFLRCKKFHQHKCLLEENDAIKENTVALVNHKLWVKNVSLITGAANKKQWGRENLIFN